MTGWHSSYDLPCRRPITWKTTSGDFASPISWWERDFDNFANSAFIDFNYGVRGRSLLRQISTRRLFAVTRRFPINFRVLVVSRSPYLRRFRLILQGTTFRGHAIRHGRSLFAKVFYISVQRVVLSALFTMRSSGSTMGGTRCQRLRRFPSRYRFGVRLIYFRSYYDTFPRFPIRFRPKDYNFLHGGCLLAHYFFEIVLVTAAFNFTSDCGPRQGRGYVLKMSVRSHASFLGVLSTYEARRRLFDHLAFTMVFRRASPTTQRSLLSSIHNTTYGVRLPTIGCGVSR